MTAAVAAHEVEVGLAQAMAIAVPLDSDDEDIENDIVVGPNSAAAAPGDSPADGQMMAPAILAASAAPTAHSAEAHRAANRATDPSLVQRAAEVMGVDGDDDCSTRAESESEPGPTDEHPGVAAPPSAAPPTAAEASPRLGEVLLSLGWTFPSQPNQAGSQGRAPPDYLDGSCLIYAEDRLLDVVDFRGAHSAVISRMDKASSATFEWSAGKGQAAGVLHSGDVMSGEGGTHVIRVRLSDLPPRATDCFFVVSAYNCRNLSLFRTVSMRLLDAEKGGRLLARYTIADAGKSSAVVVCSLSRRLEVWSCRHLGLSCDATVRDYKPVESALVDVQAKHLRWRRRGPYVLLSALWLCGRATLRDAEDEDMGIREGAEEADVLPPLLKLPAQLFQCVLQLI